MQRKPPLKHTAVTITADDPARESDGGRAWLLRRARVYGRHALLRDLVAGATVGSLIVPQSMAYALLAGLPPETGLYTSFLPLLGYATFGSSSHLAVGPGGCPL